MGQSQAHSCQQSTQTAGASSMTVAVHRAPHMVRKCARMDVCKPRGHQSQDMCEWHAWVPHSGALSSCCVITGPSASPRPHPPPCLCLLLVHPAQQVRRAVAAATRDPPPAVDKWLQVWVTWPPTTGAPPWGARGNRASPDSTSLRAQIWPCRHEEALLTLTRAAAAPLQVSQPPASPAPRHCLCSCPRQSSAARTHAQSRTCNRSSPRSWW